MEKEYFQMFMIFWFVLGIISFLFFHFNKNVKLKRVIFPVFVIIVGIIFGSFVAFSSNFSPQTLVFMIPVIIVITFLSIRNTRFCDNCGKTNYSKSAYTASENCAKCEARL